MNGKPIGSLDAVTIDSIDPESLARFWSAVFGTEVDTRNGEPVHYLDLFPAAGAPTLRFQRVADPKITKDRLHFDVLVDDIDAAVEQVEELGATRVADGRLSEYAYSWQVMLDPEGNEFCLACRDD